MTLQDFFTKLKPREKIIFLVTAGVVFLALMDRLVIGPILSRMKVMDAEVETQWENIKRDRRILSFRERILEEYAKYSNYLDTGEKTQDEIIASLLKKIETLAKQQEVTVSSVRPGDVEEKPVYQIYKTIIECEGTLNNVLAFMNLLEQSDYLFQITKYTMIPKSKGAEIIKCSMDIERILITVEMEGKKANSAPPAEKEKSTPKGARESGEIGSEAEEK
jgi:hypothetical protein